MSPTTCTPIKPGLHTLTPAQRKQIAVYLRQEAAWMGIKPRKARRKPAKGQVATPR